MLFIRIVILHSLGTRWGFSHFNYEVFTRFNMATPLLVNYFNGARVLLKQVLSRHNSLEGKVIFLHYLTLQDLQISMTFKVCITENLKLSFSSKEVINI